MRKILIITYYWPPSGGSGVQRWLKFVKYLRDFGWEPIIYTPENPENPVIDKSLLKDIPENLTVLKNKIFEPYSFYKTFTGKGKKSKIKVGFSSEKKTSSIKENIAVWIRSNFFIPDAKKFWIKKSVKFLNKYLKTNTVDIIVSTGPPHSLHIIAQKIKTKTNIPWLADFRDPWTNIDFYKELKLSKFADNKHHKLEFSVLKNANAVTVISPGMEKDFTEIYKRKYHIIPNGFDWDDIKTTKNIELDAKFTISHIGSMSKTRNPNVLWEAISELTHENSSFKKDLEIKIIGSEDYSVKNSVSKYNLKNNVKYIKHLPHNEIITMQRKTQVLLLIINNTPNAKLVMTGKIFEYLASKRPILCIGPEDGDAAKVIYETSSGLVSGFENKELLKINILKYYKLFLKNKLNVKSVDIEKYSRKNLTEDLVCILGKMVNIC